MGSRSISVLLLPPMFFFVVASVMPSVNWIGSMHFDYYALFVMCYIWTQNWRIRTEFRIKRGEVRLHKLAVP